MRDKDNNDAGHWAIVDCQPEETTFCGNTYHEWLRSPKTAAAYTSCPWSPSNMPWEYCDEHPGCNHYTADPTLFFTSCVKTSLNYTSA